MGAYRTFRRAIQPGSPRARVGSLLGLLLIGLSCVVSVPAQVAEGQPPAAYLKIMVEKPVSGDAMMSQAFLLRSPPNVKEEAKGLLRQTMEKGKDELEEETKALLMGALLGLGDRWPIENGVVDRLRTAPPLQKVAILSGAQYGPSQPELEALLPELMASPDAGVAPAAQAMKAAWDRAAAGGGSVLTFLVLILLTVVGGLVYAASFATQLDPLKGKIQDWTNKPATREDILKEVRAVEDAIGKLLGYFSDKTLVSAEIAGLLDMLSHFDEPRVHAKLREMSGAKTPAIRSAAIQSMYRLAAPEWEAELLKFLTNGDEIAQYAAAKALAERGSVSALPILQERFDAAIPGSVKDGLGDAIERLRMVAQR